MKVNLESLAESLDRLAEKKHLGPVERGTVATAADAVRELKKIEERPPRNCGRFATAFEVVAAVNERDRLRDIVRQMAKMLEYVSKEYRFDFFELVREARAAIGEGAPASPCASAHSVVSSPRHAQNP